MDPLRIFYKILINAAGPPAAALLSAKGRFGGRWAERLGFLTSLPAPQRLKPRLIFHAASAGEMRSAAAVIGALLPLAEKSGLHPEIYLSVGSPAGLSAAEKLLIGQRRLWVLAAPVDFWGAPGRYLDALRPRALIIMETELWPNLIESAHKRGISLMLAAARLSGRSFGRYKKIPGFMGRLLKRFDHIAAIGPRERDLYAALGAPKESLSVSGNPKFDSLISEAQSPAFQEITRGWREKLRGDGPLITAGSTHPGEEEIIAGAFETLTRRFPAARLLLAPRHLNRLGGLMDFLRGRNFSVSLSSCAGAKGGGLSCPIILADQMGLLMNFYAASDMAVVGGSLIKGLTGHNPLEAAAARAPMLFGPYMESFAPEARGLLSAGGAAESGAGRLAADMEAFLDNPGAARKTAENAWNYLAGRGQAAPILAERILKLISSEESHV